MILKTDYFQLWFPYKSALRRVEHFQTKKNENIFKIS